MSRTLGEERPRFGNWDRGLWVVLARRWDAWRHALAIVQPATVIRWQMPVHPPGRVKAFS
jgi:hypothetical protein